MTVESPTGRRSSRALELRLNEDAARATLKIAHDAPSFLLLPTLLAGLGSYRVGLDRGEPGIVRHVRWQRAGESLVLVQLNDRFIASGGGRAIQDSFAQSALFRTPILSEDSQGVVVDITALATQDFLNIRARIDADLGPTSFDPELCWLSVQDCAQHDAGVELTAFLTLVGARPDYRRVAPDPAAITLCQRLTLIALPAVPMVPRRFHVASGGYGKRFMDSSLAQNHSQESAWQPRFRLERTDNAVPSRVRVPIVFSIDPEIPQPWLDAVVEGGNWWNEAFEKAGFIDAYRVEVRSPETDPAAAGVNSVWWVHRADRGPSFGAALTDPRSGEILKGNVRLGAQRLQQLTQLGEALLSPYGRIDEASRLGTIDSMVTSRVRQLAAHEIAHALGFMHNFASHLSGKLSVTDYPFPVLSMDHDGEIDLSHAYSTGLSDWDLFLVRSAYGQFEPEEEASQLAKLRREVREAGHQYLTDDDGNAISSSHPSATPWVFGSDPLLTLETILKVRAKAIADFSRGAVPPGTQTGELERRFALVHLLHRYQIAAIAKIIGGVGYAYGDADDETTAPWPVDPAVQHRALDVMVDLLGAGTTAVPEHVVDLLAPPSIRFERTSADFVGALGPVFDPLAASAASAALVCQHLFEPSRLNRMSAQHVRDALFPSPADAVSSAYRAVEADVASGVGLITQSAETVRAVILQELIHLLRGDRLHAQCRRQVRAAVDECAEQLDQEAKDEVRQLLDDHTRPMPWARPVIPEGWPL